jgi:hypothetical protein
VLHCSLQILPETFFNSIKIQRVTANYAGRSSSALYCWPILTKLMPDIIPTVPIRCFTLSELLFYLGCIIYKYKKSLITNKKFWEELIAYFPWYDTGHIKNDASNNSSIVACVFVTAVKFLPSRCLAKIGRFLPSRCLATIGGYTYRHTDWWEGWEAVEMGSGTVIYVPSFIKTGSGIHKLIGGIHTQTATWSHRPILFFKIRKVG